nr:MAG TPA: hypothetical protein [Caudoviricetes sp.]
MHIGQPKVAKMHICCANLPRISAVNKPAIP